ncbi:type II toxin-antitoxin system RelE family toxin [Roseospira goensis]|uniref:mRNA interferase RelE/StbE n=1 Tax=Roseospira goensis TaxID=391922 RepID=A0A7W6WLX1_9PROT|nr:type II toxin-antitoxin system RelE/ParE family toxin [Roseospira goensis]MBB4287836.1 mRNA interferase RelE/StbE [Roseospira goensis]
MHIRYTAKAQKELRKIGPAASTIVSKIEQYAADPASLQNNTKALKGSDAFRLRVGDYRVLFTVSQDGTLTIMTVIAIRHRKDAYDRP